MLSKESISRKTSTEKINLILEERYLFGSIEINFLEHVGISRASQNKSTLKLGQQIDKSPFSKPPHLIKKITS